MNAQNNNTWLILLTVLTIGGAILFCIDGYKRFQFSQDVDVLSIQIGYFSEEENRELTLEEEKEEEMIDYLSKHLFIKSEKKNWSLSDSESKVPILSVIVQEGDEQGKRYRLRVVAGEKEVGITSLDEKNSKEILYELKEKDWEQFQKVFFSYLREE